jgi:hypothetical protein
MFLQTESYALVCIINLVRIDHTQTCLLLIGDNVTTRECYSVCANCVEVVYALI